MNVAATNTNIRTLHPKHMMKQIINLTTKNNTMANMGYVRFENTYQDLRDCYENWDNPQNESEEKYRKWMLELAEKIVNEFSTED
jgi:predicted secreted protein